MWFAQIQANFCIHHVRSQSEVCFYVVQSLLAKVADKFCDLIYEIPVGYSHSLLKDPLIKRTGLSYQQSFGTFFTSAEIG